MSDFSYSKKEKKDPQEDIRKINRMISEGDFRNVYLLYGTEDYLRLQLRDKLTKALGGVAGSLSYDRFIGADTSPERIVDTAETMPFMTDRRVILIEDTGWFKSKKKGGDDDSGSDDDAGPAKGNTGLLVDYIRDGICETTSIVFCEREAEKNLRLYKAIAEKGIVLEFITQTEDTLVQWICNKMKQAGVSMTGTDARVMIDTVGTDMLTLDNEINKLAAYCMDRGSATRADIGAICCVRLEDRVFDLCEAIALRNQRRAMRLYHDLLALQETPYKILVLITRQFDTVFNVGELALARLNDKEIASRTGRPWWSIRDYKKQASQYTQSELRSIIELCADTDMSVKTGAMSAPVALETLMVRLTDRRD